MRDVVVYKYIYIYIYARWSVYMYIYRYMYVYSLRDVAVYLYARCVRDEDFEGLLLYDIYHLNYRNITETYNRTLTEN